VGVEAQVALRLDIEHCQSVAMAESLTRIGSFKWVLAYLPLPNNQAKVPKQNSETATTAKGNAGNQIGMLCILKGLTNAATAISPPKLRHRRTG
jgi:hypothetical protein